MGHESVVKILLQNGAEVNIRDKDLYSPLHAAAASGQVFVVQQLLEAGADFNASNSFGNTPLHTACLNGHELVCQDLIASGTSVSAVNLAGQTPIHVSAAATHGERCLGLLIERDANINFQAKDGRTPLHMTAIHGRFMRAQMLLDRGALVDIGDKEGCTALHIAAAHGHELLIGVLLNVGADPSRKGRSGMTPMHLAALSGYVECCRKLLQVRGELDAQDDCGRTCLHLCAFKGNAECLDLLISSGADFNLIDSFGRIPLHYAASQAHFQCVYTLVSVGSSVNLTDSTGATALHYAAAMDTDGKCVEYLLKRKADVSALDKQGYSVLHYAAAGGQHGALHVLLKHFVIPNSNGHTDESMNVSPLHLAAYKGHKGGVTSLAAIHPDVNITDSSGRTALDLSAQFGHIECINALIEHGAQPVAQPKTLLTAVHRAAANGHSLCLKQLLHTHMQLVDVRDSKKRTPLMLAVQNENEGRKACTDILLSYTSQVDLFDNNGRTALHYASCRGFEDCVSSLLDAKASPYQKDFLGKTPFHLAAAMGHVYVLKQLIQQGADSLGDVKLLDHQSYTPLHWAAYKGRENCVEVLLGLDSGSTSLGNQFTPLHCAVSQGNELCAAVLLDHLGPSAVHAKDGIGQTAVHVASSCGSADMLLLLLNYGPDLNGQDIYQRTPTMLAAKGHITVLELLLSQCVDLFKRDRNGNTALHYACLASAESAALMLLERIEPELIDSPNAHLRTPLHIAARNGLVVVTQTLLEKGASLTVIDVNGYNPALSCAPNAAVADCLSMMIHIMIDSVTNNGRRSDSLTLSNLGNARKSRDSNAEAAARRVSRGEDDDDDPESYSIRSSDSEFY
ncbi:serine/threonine-protein phosphatase 6 regulatory ankyrin repeat subunit A-like isoform X3 [Daphnia pulex]|nr:serine/threonine-protein phosphatase 6 regulatory ankyrin repeat subunit A-like isoform X3 [Daphnia pulex]